MAEFSEVMKQYQRMIEAMKKGYSIPAYANYNCAFNYPEDFEKEVMSWAAVHPEPVYPTWGDWLAEMGLINWNNNGEGVYSVMVPTFKMCKPIPADIAEKLGLKPKEGQK